MRVLGVSGSLRRDSHNTRLLRAAAALLSPEAEFVEFDALALKALPPFDEDDEPTPGPAVDAWRAAVTDADAILFATPEYNHTIPGQLKNAVDWASRPSARPAPRGTPVAVVGTSAGMFGAVWAQADLRKTLAAGGARVIDRELPVPGAAEAFKDDGTLVEDDTAHELRGILTDLLAEVAIDQERVAA